MAKKKASLAKLAAGSAFIEDEELEDFVPHYQRVSISGDDSTGVSFLTAFHFCSQLN